MTTPQSPTPYIGIDPAIPGGDFTAEMVYLSKKEYAALQAENAELRELVKAAIKITNGNMPEKWRNEAEQALTRPPEVK
jgi:hypothetical protein